MRGTHVDMQILRPEVRLSSFTRLSNPHYLRGLKSAAARLGYPRRFWRLALAEWLEEFEGVIYGEDGERLAVLPDVDLVFGDDDDDKWAGDFARECPPDKRPVLSRRVWRRAQLIDAYIRHEFPRAFPVTLSRLSPA